VIAGVLDLFTSGGLFAATSFPEALDGLSALAFLIAGGALTAGLPMARSPGLEISMSRVFMLTLFFLWPAAAAFDASLLIVLLGALFPGRDTKHLRLYLLTGAAAAASMLGALTLIPFLLPGLSGMSRAVIAVPAILISDVAVPGIAVHGLAAGLSTRSGRTLLLYIALLPVTMVCALLVMQSGIFGAALVATGISGFSLLCRSIDSRFQSNREKIEAISSQSRLASLLIGSPSSAAFMRTLEGFLGGSREGDVLLLARTPGEEDWAVSSSAGQRMIPSMTLGGEPPLSSGTITELTVDGRKGSALCLQDGGGFILFTRGNASRVISSHSPNLLENLVLMIRQTWEAVGHTMKSERAFLAAAVLLARLADSKDDYTHGHSLRVSSLSCSLGEQMGLSHEAMKTLRVGAILHDLGKLAIPVEILTKKGLLTRQERELVQNHPDEGARIVSGLTGYEEVARIIRSHHERLDGNGYPDGLSGTDVPFLARIVAVADTFDAITSTRTYHTNTGQDTAMETIRTGRGRQFDARVVDALEAIMLEGEVHRNA
jgi:putative nucleotidyltransferase with HDIG domain